MLRDLTIGSYLAGDSVLHRLDPRTKLLSALMLMAATFVVSRIPAIVLLFVLSSGLYGLGRLPARHLWRNLRPFFWLYAITFAIHLFFHPGQVLIAVPILGIAATLEGLQAGILFTLRIAVLISVSSLLLTLTTPQDLTDGLERMLRPLSRLGMPIAEGALALSIALRFVPIFFEEAEKIRRAQISRGADLEGAWPIRIRKTLPVILPLFAGAQKRADDLAMALEARAYQGGRGRTQMMALQLKMADALSLTMALMITAGFWLLR